jgi:hypothetical protein
MQVRSKLLREARKSAERGYRLIEAQTRIIISLKAAGVDTTDAENTLEAFVKAQDCRLAELTNYYSRWAGWAFEAHKPRATHSLERFPDVSASFRTFVRPRRSRQSPAGPRMPPRHQRCWPCQVLRNSLVIHCVVEHGHHTDPAQAGTAEAVANTSQRSGPRSARAAA